MVKLMQNTFAKLQNNIFLLIHVYFTIGKSSLNFIMYFE